MTGFRLLQMISATEVQFLIGLQDLALRSTEGAAQLYSLSHSRRFAANSWEIAADGRLQLIGSQNLYVDQTPVQMQIALSPDGSRLLIAGADPAMMLALSIAPGGRAAGPPLADVSPGYDGRLSAIATTATAAFGLTSEAAGPFALDPQSGLAIGPMPGPPAAGSPLRTALSAIDRSHDSLLASLQSDGSITAWTARPGSLPRQTAHISPEAGPGISAPSDLIFLHSAGTLFLLVTGSGSSSLSSFRTETSGGLTPVFHLVDSLGSRFEKARALAGAETASGRSFLVAGGGDEGLSLFELLPDGRPLHLSDWVFPATDMPPGNLRTLVLRAVEAPDGSTRLDLYAAGEHPGLLVLSAATGTLSAARTATAALPDLTGTAANDLLIGGPGSGRLSGGAGDDRLISGTGLTLMEGGRGADIFVITPGSSSRILDFTPGEDRLDLSGLPMLYSPAALGTAPLAGGITLTWRDSRIDVLSAGGGPLSLTDFGPDFLRGPFLWQLRSETAAGPQELTGGPGQDQLSGGSGDDLIYGGAGDDFLYGGAGRDHLYGGSGQDALYAGPGGPSQLYGGAGDDRLYAGAGGDHLSGDDGHDLLFAGTEAELWYRDHFSAATDGLWL